MLPRLLPLVLALCAPFAHAQEASPDAPNIVLILADDLGYGELGCYGQSLIPTPNLDRLAAEGMRFTRAYSGAPVCAPSRAVLLSGKHAGHTLVRNNWENGGFGGPGDREGQYPLPPNAVTLSRSLQEAGYATGCVGKWGQGGPFTSGHPNRQGFDFFYGYLCQRRAHNYYPTHLWRNETREELGNEHFAPYWRLEAPLDDERAYYDRIHGTVWAADPLEHETLDFVRRHADERFFLWVTTPIPHVALQVPEDQVDHFPREWDTEPYLGTQGYVAHPRPRAAYAAMIEDLDTTVGHLLDLFDELQLAEDTLVIFTSDNGATYAGGCDHEFFDSVAGLRGLKGSVYEGGLRVPWIARWPGRIAPNTESAHVTSFQDFFPTFADLSGIEAPADTDGISLVPTLLGQGEQAVHENLYWELGNRQAVLTRDQWKLVRTALDKPNPKTELFHLATDPLEEHDLSEAEPEQLERLLRLADELREPSEIFPLRGVDVP